MQADNISDIYNIETDENGKSLRTRSSSVPKPTIFLASNINNRKQYNICNIILYVILGCAIFLALILLIICILSWLNREANATTTTPIPERELFNRYYTPYA